MSTQTLCAGMALAGFLWIGPAESQTPPRYEISIEKNAPATMRDGTILRADVYHLRSPGRFPAMLQRTPYSKNPARASREFGELARRGYAVVIQDTRGRYMSDGVAQPHDEAQDGFDTIAWVAQLPYVNGKVGMFGGSYLASTQLLAATLKPPALVALFPASSYASRYDMVFQGGAFYLSDGLGWNLDQAVDVRRRVLTPEANRDGPADLNDAESKAFHEQWLWHVPLKTMDALEIRKYAPGYFLMLEHPTLDAYWRTFDIAARHDQFQVPAYHLTGWYDTLLTGTLRNFTGLRAHAATEQARRYQRLVIGPWTHARPTLASTKIGDVDFGSQAGLDSQELMARWFAYWLQGGDRAIIEGAPVRIFIMGENRWRDEQEWPLKRARSTEYYLGSGGHANTAAGDGMLSPQPSNGSSADRFVYDPSDPVPTGALGGYSRTPSDQRETEKRADVLVYSSAALSENIEVTGPISVKLWVASSARDTDFTAKLVDVFPDGTARALNDGILRARYRESRTRPVLLEPGQPVEITIDVGATGNLFKSGHRIRLDISSSNFPRFDRNPNTGGAFGEDSTLLRAEQTILHDAMHPSRLVLPVVAR
jgi:putative CocE/NonD family hydrolase